MPDYHHGDWHVHVSEHEDFRAESWEAVFRRTVHLNKECEKFTLMVEGRDDAFLMLYLYDDGTFSFEVYAPSLIRLGATPKSLFVGVFDRSTWERVP